MSVNRFKPHVLLIPEDDKDRQIANGFHLETDPDKFRQMQVLNPPGGWEKVVDDFLANHVGQMKSNPNRFVILLIDFDGREDRRDLVKGRIPKEVSDRVFVFGTRNEPETFLKSIVKDSESAGRQLAKDCRDATKLLWAHDQLEHNFGEIRRAIAAGVLEIIF